MIVGTGCTIGLGYWTAIIQHANKSMFKEARIKSNVYYICSNLKKLIKLMSVTERLSLI